MSSVSSSDEEDGLLGGHPSTAGRVGKVVFFSLLVSGAALGGFFVGRMTKTAEPVSVVQVNQAPQEAPPQQAEGPLQPRLLESDELAETAAHHTLAFYGELGLPLHELSPEMTTKLRKELANEARLKVQHITNTMEVEQPEAARELRELRVTPEQWKHTHKILHALHDSRVQQIGKSVSLAISHAKNEEEAREATQRKLADHKDELAGLAQELLPAGVRKASQVPQDASASWAMTINHKSHAVHTEGPIGNWHAAFEVAPPKFGRRLQSAPMPGPVPASSTETGIPDWLVTTMGGLYVTVGSMGAIIVGIISMLLSAIAGRAGALGTWWTYVGLNIAECGTQLGLTLGVAQLRAWWQWVPCWLMSCFTGLEAIWVWIKA